MAISRGIILLRGIYSCAVQFLLVFISRIPNEITFLVHLVHNCLSGIRSQMHILLTDGGSLTSRQIAGILSRQGHHVEAVKTSGLALSSFTSCVRRTHIVPLFSTQPFNWLDAVLNILRSDRTGFDILLCTQEQITVLALEAVKVTRLGVGLCVPPLDSLAKVYTKISAYDTLNEAGLPQPNSIAVSSASELLKAGESLLHDANGDGSIYIKRHIGTASTGVYHCTSIPALSKLCTEFSHASTFSPSSIDPCAGKILVQTSMRGPLIMIQSVFSHGTLLSWHACLRTQSGPGNGSTHKTSCPLEIIPFYVGKLGKFLNWHGGLSFDAILADANSDPPKIYFIDVNPRPVEPMNALLSGTDLVTPLLELSLEKMEEGRNLKSSPSTSALLPAQSPSKAGVKTHQFLLSLLACTSSSHPRLAVFRELFLGTTHQGLYHHSTEELTPLTGDFLYTSLLLALITLGLLIWPWGIAKLLEEGAVGGYAGSAKGWEMILKRNQDRMEIGKTRS
jgi:hypothetical protein